jgi:uncharacterized protein
MRKFKAAVQRVIALSIFLIPTVINAQGNFKQPSAAATGLHCLWKAQGASNTVYLLGSVHLLKETDYPLPAVIESAFSNSQIAVFETDLDKLESPEEQAKMMSKISLPEGQTLKQNLSPKVYESFSKHAGEVGLPIQALEQFRPAAAVMTLEVMELLSLGVNPDYGVDKHFLKLARDSGKRIVPLETTDFQIGLLVGFSKAEEDLMVEKSLEEIDDEKKLYNEMLDAWKTGNAAALERMLNKLRIEAPSIFKRLVTDRTASWIPEFDTLLHGSQNAIIIVGAGHLVGPDGAIELLRKKGVKVTQL